MPDRKLLDELWITFHEVLVLPLLPGGLIEKGHDTIVQEFKKLTAKVGENELFAEALSNLKVLIDYIKSYWFEKWKVDEISVHRKDHRTNNGCESYHKWLNKSFKNSRSTPKLLISNHNTYINNCCLVKN